jgi:hypothetical protein
MKTVTTALLLLFTACCYSQENDKRYWSKDSLLTWAEFKAPVDVSSSFDAFTISGITYNYKWHLQNGKYTADFTVTSYFLPGKSWTIADKQTPELLKHEQTHFDISEYFARQLLVAFNSYAFTPQIKEEIVTIYQRIEAERARMETIYDQQTNHSADTKIQNKWNAFIAILLSGNPPLEDTLKSDFLSSR